MRVTRFLVCLLALCWCAGWCRQRTRNLALKSEWTGYRWGLVSRANLVPSLLDADGYLPLLAEAVEQRATVADVEHELRAQIEQARATGRLRADRASRLRRRRVPRRHLGPSRLGRAWRQADFDMVRSPVFQRFLREQGFTLVGW